MAVALMNDKKRNATVEVYTKQVQHTGSAGSFGTIGGMFTQHWGVIINFDDDVNDLVYVCEANPDKKNLIIPSCIYKSREDVVRGAEVFQVGRINTNPQELEYYCNQISSNGTSYNMIINNCQKWVLELLKKFGLEFEEGWMNAETGALIGIGVGVGIASIGGLVCLARASKDANRKN